MRNYNVKNLVFSSSATVYGDVSEVPPGGLREDQPTLPPTNPYGRTKFFVEEILKDVHRSDNSKIYIYYFLKLKNF
jgi:UDP-glucose 4-epimerase